MKHLTPYERQALEEIRRWPDEEPGLLEEVFNTVLRPIEWILEQVVPREAQQTLQEAVLGALEFLKEVSFWTYSEKTILAEARELGIRVARCEDLAMHDMEKFDALARKQFDSNQLMAALEGAGCGAGGLALVAADIPILFGLVLRAIQQIGTCYGFDMRDPLMWPVILHVLNAASAGKAAVKAAILADMTLAAKALAKNWTYKRIAEKTQTGIAVIALKNSVKGLPREIAGWVTKRKLAQLIPLAGAAIGAGFNYWFLSQVCNSAYMIFRNIHLKKLREPQENPPNMPCADQEFHSIVAG